MAVRKYRAFVLVDSEKSLWRDAGVVEASTRDVAERAILAESNLAEGVPFAVFPDSDWQPVAKTRKQEPQYEVKPWAEMPGQIALEDAAPEDEPVPVVS